MNTAVHIEKLTFKYDTDEVLKDIDIEIPKGSFVGILGPNGSGKTTLLKNICNILKPDNGKILINNKNVSNIKYKELAKIIAVVHQTSEIQFQFSVFDVVLMGRFPYLSRFQSEGKKDIEIAKEAMLSTGTWELRDKSINEISGGERQRVMIARALTQQPQILILDEPISHLDIKYQIGILDLCKKLNVENQITVIMTLHDINLAGRYSDYLILLDKGRIKVMDTPEKVLTQENISNVYDIEVDILKRNGDKTPYIIPI
ncbi:iron complex transport system ATP-binding protein [Proteiniborus ethanoligenes]|uniref:Iron complex transport system ATP-binding protein n=1 Tax=Proteiniborus ethanoligenes TaxID=415015 RepID=A0A1H3QJE7_9FIRM|nr:ABC transporter ATP-binding protein [Proteiniborus ethanoligenes]SDZ13423.1 iron complex transport system ATP-binding protein [Proteiniborus ethanoligenes]